MHVNRQILDKSRVADKPAIQCVVNDFKNDKVNYSKSYYYYYIYITDLGVKLPNPVPFPPYRSASCSISP